MSNAGYIRNGLLQRGMPGYVADAFIANFQDESGLNPGINEAKPLVPGSRGGFGLFQSTGPRRRALESVAADRGLPASDIDTQLDVLTAELGMPGTGLDNHSWFGSEARAAGRIFGAKDTASAAQAIVNDFLRPSPEHRRSRTARYASLGGAPSATMSDATSFFPNERMPSSLDRAPSSGASPMVSNYGSLGGLGGYSSAPERPVTEPGIRGFLKSDGFGDWLGAMGASLMSSPGNAPLQNMPTLLANAQDNRSRAQERAEDRDWRRMNFELGRQDRMQERQWGLQDREEERRNAIFDYEEKLRIERESQAAIQQPFYDRLNGPSIPSSSASTVGITPDPVPNRPALSPAMLQPTSLSGSAPAAFPPMTTPPRGSGNTTYDALITEMDRVGALLSEAPDQETFQRTKARYDYLASQAERYAPTGFRQATAEEAAGYGAAAGQVGPDGRFYSTGERGPSVVVNNGDTGGSGKFYENLDKVNAEMFGTLLSSAPNAQTNLARVDRLETMLGELGPGWQNNATRIAGNLGIDLGNASGVQAAQALINSMVPEQRAPGSGPMSDADLELFKQSLPRIINTPEGNRQIIETLRGISQYQLSQADIAGKVAAREITPEQGNAMLRTLTNPVAWLREAELPEPIAAPLSEGGNVPTITSKEAYDALPSGAQYRAPDGEVRTKR